MSEEQVGSVVVMSRNMRPPASRCYIPRWPTRGNIDAHAAESSSLLFDLPQMMSDAFAASGGCEEPLARPADAHPAKRVGAQTSSEIVLAGELREVGQGRGTRDAMTFAPLRSGRDPSSVQFPHQVVRHAFRAQWPVGIRE
jgi:hypothetical protein